MRVTFVALGWEQLGVSLLAAIAKEKGHEVNLAFSVSLFHDRYNLSFPPFARLFDDTKDVLKKIEDQRPDVLAFSALTGTYQWMLGIAQEAKKIYPHVKVIFGGVHASAVPERVIHKPQVDFVCVGEGDVAFPMILNAIEKGGPMGEIIPNTRYKLPNGQIVRGPQTGFIQDLDALPGFDKTIWEDYIRVGDVYFTMASRGCPYRCTFCFNNFFANLPEEKKGKYVRQRSVDHMLNELHIAKKRYKLKIVDFEDDVFTVDKKWVKSFLDRYKKEIKVPFQCLTHPKYIDEDVAKWLADAGCVHVQMGIQTMDDEYKFQTVKRYEKSKDVEQAMALMQKYNLKAKVDHMFGLPGEPLEAQEKALTLYKKHTPYRIQTFWTNFLPGTEMVQQAKHMGLIEDKDIERLEEGLNFDFYRSSQRIDDPLKHKMFKRYEVLFKLIPIVPPFVRQKMRIDAFRKMPIPLCEWLTFSIDLLAGLLKCNPDHIGYAKHYLLHLYNAARKCLGLQPLSATRSKGEKNHTAEPPPPTHQENRLKSREVLSVIDLLSAKQNVKSPKLSTDDLGRFDSFDGAQSHPEQSRRGDIQKEKVNKTVSHAHDLV